MKARTRALSVAAVAAIAALVLVGCSSAQPSTSSSAKDSTPIDVGVLVPITGALSSFAGGYEEGMTLGLKYATKGTNKVNGHPINLEFTDDGTDPTKAVAAATNLVGGGVKILAGTISSGVTVPIAQFAAQNNVLFIDGGGTTDAITGINRETFRANRGSYQEIANIVSGVKTTPKKVVIVVQDNAFGTSSAASAATVFQAKGAKVQTILAPAAGTDFTTIAKQVLDANADLVFVTWAGSNLGSIWQALDQQGVIKSKATVTTVLGSDETWPSYPEDSSKIVMGSPYIPGFGSGAAGKALNKGGSKLNVESSWGFTTSQMIVRALTKGSIDNQASMEKALEGWTFDSPKGKSTIRAKDHAMIEPMYVVSLKGSQTNRSVKLLSTTPADSIAPPVFPSAWAK